MVIGRSVMLPKIKIVSAADGDVIQIDQAAISCAFAILLTINKSQGQSLRYLL
jgi:hypothetical protein